MCLVIRDLIQIHIIANDVRKHLTRVISGPEWFSKTLNRFRKASGSLKITHVASVDHLLNPLHSYREPSCSYLSCNLWFD